MSIIANKLTIAKNLPISFVIENNGIYLLSGESSELIFKLLYGDASIHDIKGTFSSNGVDILHLDNELIHYYHNGIFVFNSMIFLNKKDDRLDSYLQEVSSIVKRKHFKIVLIDCHSFDNDVFDTFLSKLKVYSELSIFVLYRPDFSDSFKFESYANTNNSENSIIHPINNNLTPVAQTPIENSELTNNKETIESNLVEDAAPKEALIEEKKDKDPMESLSHENSNESDLEIIPASMPKIEEKAKPISYGKLLKKYHVHYIFVLIFTICSSLGWFFFGFYKSPYNYYKGFEANMTQEQINERIAKGESVSSDFLWGWVISLIISIILTIICCYGIITFRKTIHASKKCNYEYESKAKFSMFVVIMLFGLFLTGVGIMIFYSFNVKLMGFYYGNIDIFFTLLISIVIETALIFVPYIVFQPKLWKTHKNKKDEGLNNGSFDNESKAEGANK
jgi:hypothetical protein